MMRPLIFLALALAPLAVSCKTEEPPPPPPPPPPDCGNGMLEEGEECEGGIPFPMGCNPNRCKVLEGWACSPEPPDTESEATGGVFEPIEWESTCEELDTCGDGVLDPGEACDDGDGNTMEGLGDGCSNCTIDPLWTCMGEPSECQQCGDGFLDEGEECDDGEEIGMDSIGCAFCMVEPGWECFPGPAVVSVCGPLCGDGMFFDMSIPGVTIGFAEQCDDGNTDDGDGCDSSCEIEEDCECTGAAPTTSTCSCGGTDSSSSGSGSDSSGSSTDGSSSGGSGGSSTT